MAEKIDNPMATDGFEFVEYTAPGPDQLRTLFERLGFPVVARHRRKNVTLHRQGDINFIINAERGGFGQQFAAQHGPSACAMAFRVRDAAAAYARALALGAEPGPDTAGPMELNIPSIRGIGGSLIYLVDRYGGPTIYEVDFVPVKPPAGRPPSGGSGPAPVPPRADGGRPGGLPAGLAAGPRLRARAAPGAVGRRGAPARCHPRQAARARP